MFFFPYSTDAPLYHWPVATILLIGRVARPPCATGSASASVTASVR